MTVLNVYNERYDPSEEEGWEPWPGWVKPVPEWSFRPLLPGSDSSYYGDHWHPWFPEQRIDLPAYVPDVAAGVASPVVLSQWKVKAIKLMIVLERRGYVTRADMRHLELSPTIWTGWNGFLAPGDERGRYVSWHRTPDFRKQHPRVWQEVEDDIEVWAAGLDLD